MKFRLHLLSLLVPLSLLAACDAKLPEETAQTETLPVPESEQTSSNPKPVGSLTKLPSFKAPTLNELPKIPDFTQYPAGSERKKAFFDFMAPLVQLANQEVMSKRARIQDIVNHFDIPPKDEAWLKVQADLFGVEPFDPLKPADQKTLLKRVDKVPVSLALAQAANESAWGTSRFARKANNYFGQWCFTKGCGLVPKKRTDGAIHEVRAFKHPYYSVVSYIHNLNSHVTYKNLRTIRAKARAKNKTPSSLAMTEGLINYSARKQEYVHELQSMIRYNKLTRFDK